MFVTAFIIIPHFFDKRRVMAMSMAASGVGVGILSFSVFTSYLLTTVEWRWTLRVYAGFSLVGGLCGLLFKPLIIEREDEENNTSNNNNEEKTEIKSNICASRCSDFIAECFPKDILKNPIFVLMCFQMICFSYSYMVPFHYTPERAQHLGISEINSAFLLSIIGFFTILNRLTFGWFGKFKIN